MHINPGFASCMRSGLHQYLKAEERGKRKTENAFSSALAPQAKEAGAGPALISTKLMLLVGRSCRRSQIQAPTSMHRTTAHKRQRRVIAISEEHPNPKQLPDTLASC